jgi:hypothetical protein
VEEGHYFNCAHELVYTWANNPDGTIDRIRLTKVVEGQLKAHYKQGVMDGRKEAAKEIGEEIDDIFRGPHIRCSNCRGEGGGCSICGDKGYVQHGFK